MIKFFGMEISNEAKKRLASLIEERDLSLAPLAAKVGVSQSTLWNFIYGETKNFSKIHQLATELKVSLDWIMGRKFISEQGRGDSFAEPDADYGGPLIPVWAQISGARDAIHIDRGKKIGIVERHPAQIGIKEAFAIYIGSDLLAPRYRPGELVYVSGKPPVAGQDCLIELANGESYLREFIAFKGGDIVCRHFRSGKEWQCRMSGVRIVYAIAGRG